MSKTPQERITELEDLNQNLAQQIVNYSDRVNDSMRPALANVWDEGYEAGKADQRIIILLDMYHQDTINPYRDTEEA